MSDYNIRKSGLRVTAPRQKILTVLVESKQRHMSAEDVYRCLLKQGNDIGLATVYRALSQFEKAGLVVKHQFGGDVSVYEIDHGEHHDHLVCVRCGKVQEFMDDVIEQRQEIIAKQFGFVLTDHHLNLYGLCPSCVALPDGEA